MNKLKQMSLKGSFSLCGKGLHTGLSLTVTFNPAPENFGYKYSVLTLTVCLSLMLLLKTW